MSKYEVKSVVCDYGVYENDELKLIVNSHKIANIIVDLLQIDEGYHRALNPQNFKKNLNLLING